MAWPQDELPLAIEMWTGAAWEDISADVRAAEGAQVAITRGQPDESSAPEPGSITATLANADGRYSPRNPLSDLYGKIGRNTPLRVRVTGGAAGDAYFAIDQGLGQAFTSDAAPLDIVGDIDVRIDIVGVQVATSAGAVLAAKYATTGNQRSWAWLLNPDGTMTFSWSTDGTSGGVLSSTSTVSAGLISGRRGALRVTVDVDNGSGGHTTTFYTAGTIDGTWVQLGSAVTVAGTTSIFSSSAILAIAGSAAFLSFTDYLTRIYAFELRSGIGGSVVANPDFRGHAAGEPSISDGHGNTWTWTLSGARLAEPGHRGIGEVSEWPPRWDVSGTDSTVTITAQGILRRLGQGTKPVRSPRTSENLRLNQTLGHAYWPMEDGANATSWASGFPSQAPLTASGEAPDSANLGPLLGSDKIPVLAPTTTLTGTVPVYTAALSPAGMYAMFIVDVPPSPTTLAAPWVDNTPIAWLSQSTTGSTVATWEIRYKGSGGGDLEMRALNASGTQLATSGTIDANIDNGQFEVQFGVFQSGADTTWQVVLRHVDDVGTVQTSGAGGTFSSLTVTTATGVRIAPSGGLSELAVGHLLVAESITVLDAIIAYAGEAAADRAIRLCAEADVTFELAHSFPVTDTVSMGAQAIPSAFIDNLTETWMADDALLFETRFELGLTLRGRETLYNQPIAVQLDYRADGEIAPDLEPTDDDQRVRNRITVTRRSGDTTGSSATVEDSTSRMGTQAPPDGVGVYEDSLDLNLETDDDLIHHAAWRVHVGTWDEARHPVVRINLTALAQQGKTDLVAQAAALDVGDRLRLVNLPIWTGADGGTVDLMCLGFTETFDYPNGWIIEINTVPYGPYQVGALAADSPSSADANVQRATGDPDCVIRTDLTTSTTSVPFDPNFMRWTTDANHFNTSKYPAMQVAVGGERMTVSAISTTAATYVAIGAASHANNTTVSPALYTGHTAGDWICVLAGVTGGAGTLSITAGYELLASPGGLYFWVKRHGSSESNPTITPSGTSSGNMISAQVFGLRNMPIFPAWIDSSVGSNASAQNIAYSGISAGVYPGRVMLILGRKTDQWTSVAVPSGFTEISEAATGTGNKQGLYAAYRIDTTPARVDPGALAVTGGTTAVSDVAVLALPGGFQTATVTRSANGVSKAHSAGDSMALYMPLIQAL